MNLKVGPVSGGELSAPLRLLEEALRGGEPLPGAFTQRLREDIEARVLEVLEARVDGRVIGVAVLAYRPSISAGGLFASVEELYVRPEARRRGVGRALLEVIAERCVARGVSYVEVQIVDDEAAAFYASSGYQPEAEVRVMSRSYAL